MSPAISRRQRKDKTPRRISTVNQSGHEEAICDTFANGDCSNPSSELKELSSIPEDPFELALAISQQPVSEYIFFPPVPKEFYSLIEKGKVDVSNIFRDGFLQQGKAYLCSFCKRKTFGTVPGLRYHMNGKCEKGPKLEYKCKVCDAVLFSESEAKLHVKNEHVQPFMAKQKSGCRRRAICDRPMKVELYEKSSSAAKVLDKQCDMHVHKDEAYLGYSEVTNEEKMLLPRVSARRGYSSYVSVDKPLGAAINWKFDRMQMLEKLSQLTKFDFKPMTDVTDGECVNLVKVVEGCKLRSTSHLFRNDYEGLNAFSSKKNTKMEQTCHNLYQSLNLFHAQKTGTQDDSFSFFVGGPVWAMDWCPFSLQNLESDQILALSTHVNEHLLDPAVTYDESGLIQFWNCGLLSLSTDDENQKTCKIPFFSFGLLVEHGPIWDIKWCPLANKLDESLGIIAVACGSSEVLIISVHCPDKTRKAGRIHAVYRAKPSAKLIAPHSNDRPFGQCMSVSWSVDKGVTNLICAGFVSGHIAVWDLTTTSDLLVSSDVEGCKIIYALHCFRGHSKVVRSVAFCPFNSEVLASGSADRYLKVWNWKSSCSPINDNSASRTSIINEIHWPYLFNGLFVGTGNEFSMGSYHGCVYYNLAMPSIVLQNVIPNKTTVWSVSFSDWLNCVADGDVSGCVTINLMNNLNRDSSYSKKVPRLLVSVCEAIWKKNVNLELNHSEFTTTQGCNQKIVAAKSDKCDNRDEYKLTFRDTNMGNLRNWEKIEGHRRARMHESYPDDQLKLPVTAVHKVRWNPNFSSFTWIASGTHSGLVRLHRASGLLNHDVMNRVYACRDGRSADYVNSMLD